MSRLLLQQRRDELLRTCPHTAILPALKSETRAALEVLHETALQIRRDSPIEQIDVALFIVREGAIVEVRGPDRHPTAVDHHDLVMQHRPVELLDFDTSHEQPPKKTNAVVAREPVVVADARHHDPNVDAATLGLDQRLD